MVRVQSNSFESFHVDITPNDLLLVKHCSDQRAGWWLVWTSNDPDGAVDIYDIGSGEG